MFTQAPSFAVIHLLTTPRQRPSRPHCQHFVGNHASENMKERIMGMSYNGWKFNIFVEQSRLIQTLVDGLPTGPTLDREDFRKRLVEARHICFDLGLELPSDKLESFERVWVVRPYEGRHKMLPVMRFIAPTFDHISQIKAARVEANKAAKAARKLRAEIARSAKKAPKAKSRAAAQPAQEGARPRQSARL